RKTKRRGVQLLIFAGSIFSVVPVFLLQYILNLFPQLNIVNFLQSQTHDQNLNVVILFVSVGIVEEIVKQALVRFVDRKYLLIQTIDDSIRYSLIAALGFACAENIFYISGIFTQFNLQQLIVAYLFRTVFTTCAHLIFSGYFGYYYGIAKFSMNIVEQSRWVGKKQILATFLSRILNMSRIQSQKELTIVKGLTIAIAMHAVFNILLQFNQIFPVAVFVAAGFLLLLRLLTQKTGKLILITDASTERVSSMPTKDEEVVIELLGMWFKGKRYVDVIHICQRLLQRDPDNKVVQLFKAQAIDKIGSSSTYGRILRNMFPREKEKSIPDMIKMKEKANPIYGEKK
ncbi:MAG TPA: PrsW family glutamic-type intramembrane protease, partial [Candidatus Gracilibacteria bacterium]|nr:PrsW family glutamic-type intramembrane protease [Candidatus Gracilibacteria bacterium]